MAGYRPLMASPYIPLILMAPMSPAVVACIFGAAILLAFGMDMIKVLLFRRFAIARPRNPAPPGEPALPDGGVHRRRHGGFPQVDIRRRPAHPAHGDAVGGPSIAGDRYGRSRRPAASPFHRWWNARTVTGR